MYNWNDNEKGLVSGEDVFYLHVMGQQFEIINAVSSPPCPWLFLERGSTMIWFNEVMSGWDR